MKVSKKSILFAWPDQKQQSAKKREQRAAKRRMAEAEKAQPTAHHEEIPDNPEVSARLSNLSFRHAGARPAWFDFEPLALPGRMRQCKKIFWNIIESQTASRKRITALTAEPGMGKTSFLSELYGMLETAPHNILTLAPGIPDKRPFQALRNILEQRFYISGEASFESITQYVTGAIESIVTSDPGRVANGLITLWQPKSKPTDASVPVQKADDFLNGFDAAFDSTHQSQQSPAQRRSPDPRIANLPKAAPTPPPLATQVTSMDSVIEAYRKSQEIHEVSQVNPAVDSSGVSGVFSDSSQPGIRKEMDEENAIPAELRGRTETTAILFCNMSEMSDEKNEPASVQPAEESTAAYVERVTQTVIQPLTQFFEADLRRNRIVIVLDDVDKFDDASLNLLGQVFMRLPELPLTIFMTAGSPGEVPAFFSRCPVEFTELQSLSDGDLALLTHSILKKLSETREKLIVPKELCNLIAQRSFGSPKRTIELTLKHLNPDSMIHWNDAIERLKHEPIPHELGLNMVRRFKETPELERMVLQVASHLSAPFTVSTIESLLSTWPDLKLPDDFSCSKLLKKLRETGFLEYADGPFSANTPSYIFKHESERMMIFSTVKRPMRHHVYLMAAQWYSLNNPNGIHDEVIGDFWRNYQYLHESCRYYKRAARRAVSASHLPEAWRLFRKLLKTLPDGNIAERTKLSLEGAAVAFRMGQVDDAFRLCRTSCHHALKISAYNQAARSCIQMASMLIEMGSIRHMHRYTARASELLNRDGDAVAVCRLYKVLARSALFMSHYDEARQYVEKARQALSTVAPHPLDALELEWTEAEIEADNGNPNKAIQMLNHVIEEATLHGEVRLKAQAYRSLGHIYDLTDNLSGALESWNLSLGMVQEMNDVILHANLLADIADGALALEARKTARAATEQCLGLAQQTHQKLLIARCLANTAALQYSNDQCDKAMRTLRKAHKSATTLKSARLWIRTLSLFARLISSDTCAQCNYEKAEIIYQRLLAICSNKQMTLEKARSLNKYAQFLVTTHQTPKALEALNAARDIYQKFDLERVVKLIQGRVEELMQTDET